MKQVLRNLILIAFFLWYFWENMDDYFQFAFVYLFALKKVFHKAGDDFY